MVKFGTSLHQGAGRTAWHNQTYGWAKARGSRLGLLTAGMAAPANSNGIRLSQIP